MSLGPISLNDSGKKKKELPEKVQRVVILYNPKTFEKIEKKTNEWGYNLTDDQLNYLNDNCEIFADEIPEEDFERLCDIVNNKWYKEEDKELLNKLKEFVK